MSIVKFTHTNDHPAIGEHVKGVVLSGSPYSVRQEDHLVPDLSDIKGKVPTLAVCYGAQYLLTILVAKYKLPPNVNMDGLI